MLEIYLWGLGAAFIRDNTPLTAELSEAMEPKGVLSLGLEAKRGPVFAFAQK
ncbi:MAG: hypothetical protein GY862_21115 [Gammaproteobacteria bacterium]|nr:hypothetical protein [Gammaproteobacteria bacterium]